jgi:CBS domain-containing protein
MQVKDIMSRDVTCISPDASLEQAAVKMRDLNVGSIPVCGQDDRLHGIITDRDIVVRVVAEGLDCQTVRVEEAMTPKIHYCFEDQDVTEAVQMMEKNQIRRLVVLNRNKRLVGIVALGDLALDTGDERLAGEALECISSPAMR